MDLFGRKKEGKGENGAGEDHDAAHGRNDVLVQFPVFSRYIKQFLDVGDLDEDRRGEQNNERKTTISPGSVLFRALAYRLKNRSTGCEDRF